MNDPGGPGNSDAQPALNDVTEKYQTPSSEPLIKVKTTDGKEDCIFPSYSEYRTRMKTDLEILHDLDFHGKKGTDTNMCALCGYVYAKQGLNIYSPLALVHGVTMPVRCRLCDKTLPTYNSGFQHLLDHAIAQEYGWTEVKNVRLKSFRCNMCQKVFKDEEVFRSHLTSCDGKVICPHCGKMFSTGSLKDHIVAVNIFPLYAHFLLLIYDALFLEYLQVNYIPYS